MTALADANPSARPTRGGAVVPAGFAHAPRIAAGSAALAAIGIFSFLLLWSVAAGWKASPIQLPGPLSVVSALRDLAADGDLWANVWVSLRRVAFGLAMSLMIAVPLGVLMGLNRRVESLIDPVVELLRPISGIAWIPLALFIFGVGDALPLFILVYVASFQLLLSTVSGVKSVDTRLIAAARTMGLADLTIVRKVVLPAALPHIMAGLRLAFAATWSAIVAAELIGAPSGVGFAIEWYRQLLATPKVFAFIAVIGAIGYVSDLLLRLLQQTLVPPERQGRARGTVERGSPHAATASGRLSALGWSLLLPSLLLAGWQICALTLPAQSPAPSPARVVAAFVSLASSGQLPAALLQSLGRVAAGFAIAFVLAVPLGLAMGRHRIVRGLLTPVVEGFRPIAPMAILPIAILWLGTGSPTAYAIVGYAAFFPLLVNTAANIARLDPQLVRAAQTMGIPARSLLWRVVLPAALPDIALGARVGLGVAWTAIVAAELAVGAASGGSSGASSGASSGGIGQMMFVFYSYSVDLNGIVVCMIAVGLVALLIDRLLRFAERRLTPWRFTHGG